MVTGLVTHAACLAHDTGAAHPERPARLEAVLARLAESGARAEMEEQEAPEVAREALARVHPEAFIAHVEAACAASPGRIDEDTAIVPASLRAAQVAAGGVVSACERVLAGRWRNAFVAVRPPGHHAEASRAMGFCLFNSIAVAARDARARGVERVAILDWDVHHGNGTQDVFESDESVFFASLHQAPLYPGTGRADERGLGGAEGTLRNCPMPAGSGDAEWLHALEHTILPELDAFGPELLLISAGFDAHVQDPLAACRVSTEGFAALSRLATDFAADRCGGRVVSVLEGGYDLDGLADSVEAHIAVLREAAGARGALD